MLAAADESQAAAAVKLLRNAKVTGLGGAPWLTTDPDFAPLRDRDDFKKLVAELAADAKSK